MVFPSINQNSFSQNKCLYFLPSHPCPLLSDIIHQPLSHLLPQIRSVPPSLYILLRSPKPFLLSKFCFWNFPMLLSIYPWSHSLELLFSVKTLLLQTLLLRSTRGRGPTLFSLNSGILVHSPYLLRQQTPSHSPGLFGLNYSVKCFPLDNFLWVLVRTSSGLSPSVHGTWFPGPSTCVRVFWGRR